MLPFLYDPKFKKEKEFVQEELRIERYIPEYDPEESNKSDKDDVKRGIEIYQM